MGATESGTRRYADELLGAAGFERAYREHSAAMRAAAQSVLHDAAAAEDVVHDVFAQLWARPGAYDASRGSLRAYLTLLARSRALDRWRSRVARDAALDRSTDDLALQEEPLPPEEIVVRRERATLALGAVEALPHAQRTALLLTFGAGLSTQEMATLAEIPLGTAKSRVRLGLQRARVHLEDRGLPQAA